MDAMPLLVVRGLLRRFGAFTAVDGLDLDLSGGEVLALLGPNGAGKTTTIRMLMGQLRPDAGSARIGGRDCFAERAEVMRLVGYVPDEPIYHDYLTGRELLRFVGALHGLDAATIAERGGAWTSRLGLGDAIDDFAVNYSRGMKKKLGLALALMPGPRLLILDEPANGLDPYATRELLALIAEQAAGGAAVLFSTHLLDQAERISHRAAILAKGRVVAQGAMADLKDRAVGGGSLEQAFFAVTAAAPGGDAGP